MIRDLPDDTQLVLLTFAAALSVWRLNAALEPAGAAPAADVVPSYAELSDGDLAALLEGLPRYVAPLSGCRAAAAAVVQSLRFRPHPAAAAAAAAAHSSFLATNAAAVVVPPRCGVATGEQQLILGASRGYPALQAAWVALHFNNLTAIRSAESRFRQNRCGGVILFSSLPPLSLHAPLGQPRRRDTCMSRVAPQTAAAGRAGAAAAAGAGLGAGGGRVPGAGPRAGGRRRRRPAGRLRAAGPPRPRGAHSNGAVHPGAAAVSTINSY